MPKSEAFLAKRFNLNAAVFIIDPARSICGRHIVVHHGKCLIRALSRSGRPSSGPQRPVRRGDLVDQVAVDIDHTGAVILAVDCMIIENLVIERFRSWVLLHNELESCRKFTAPVSGD